MPKYRGGLSGGGGSGASGMNPQKMLQKMQADMLAAQEALETETVEVSKNGITIVITGHQRVQSVTVDPATVDTSDSEWLTDLQDLLVVAVNEAIEQSQAMAAARMESITGGLGSIPGLGGLL
ncbi:MAG TPA: YbaB/EbfC family nucleoid-associated protein [Phototrophicaceae bacterium]|nr:YbaB/EbfC family nucleoid-associated protein [Phototrophicaceae bacterium]